MTIAFFVSEQQQTAGTIRVGEPWQKGHVGDIHPRGQSLRGLLWASRHHHWAETKRHSSPHKWRKGNSDKTQHTATQCDLQVSLRLFWWLFLYDISHLTDLWAIDDPKSTHQGHIVTYSWQRHCNIFSPFPSKLALSVKIQHNEIGLLIYQIIAMLFVGKILASWHACLGNILVKILWQCLLFSQLLTCDCWFLEKLRNLGVLWIPFNFPSGLIISNWHLMYNISWPLFLCLELPVLWNNKSHSSLRLAQRPLDQA